MSSVYPSWKTRVLTWVTTGGAPSNAEFMLAICDESFEYNSAHGTLAEIDGVLVDSIPLTGVTFGQGRVRADDLTIGDLDIGDTYEALILYLAWTGGTQLLCCITESEDLPLPLESIGNILGVIWSDSGVVQL